MTHTESANTTLCALSGAEWRPEGGNLMDSAPGFPRGRQLEPILWTVFVQIDANVRWLLLSMPSIFVTAVLASRPRACVVSICFVPLFYSSENPV